MNAKQGLGLKLAIDIGGTFTDMFLLDENTGEIRVAKVPSTLDPIEGVLKGIEENNFDISQASFISHGTTVATNALITRNFPTTAMVTTDGFRDVLEIGRGAKDDLWNLQHDLAKPYIARRNRLTVPERVGWTGDVLEPLDEAAAREVAEKIRRRNIDSVAVCFINSFMNSANEKRMREILQEVIPDVKVSLSSEVLPEIFEHERFSTTVVNAIMAPVVGPYVKRMAKGLNERGYKGELLLFHSGGGVLTPKTAENFSARLASSGIAAGAIACQQIAGLAGYKNAVGVDMGGTSADVSLVVNGEIRIRNDWYIEFGFPIGFPAIDVLTIGAGGGSLSWIDEGGSLRNGPQSAGATPGPACYGKGNTQATNTDANVVLGRLGTSILGGKMSLDGAAAAKAVEETVGKKMGMSTVEAAGAIIKVANANMADAVRRASIREGHDPRDFVLVAFGGAGPLHGAELARELDIPTVLVPPEPGVTAALGCLWVDIRHDLSRMVLENARTISAKQLSSIFDELETEGRSLLNSENVSEKDQTYERYVDLRYVGQWRSIRLPYSVEMEDIIKSFHEEHEREHQYSHPESEVEIYRVSIVAIGKTSKIPPREHASAESDPVAVSYRTVIFDKEYEAPVFNRVDLRPGHTFSGPAIVEQLDSTTVVPPNSTAKIDTHLNIIIEL